MAHFRGTMRGNRGEVSRLGHSSLSANLNGWHFGIDARLENNGKDKPDTASISATSGSGQSRREYLAIYITPNDTGYVVNVRTTKQTKVIVEKG